MRSIQILNGQHLPVQNLYRTHKFVLVEKIVITAFEMHIKLAKICFILIKLITQGNKINLYRYSYCPRMIDQVHYNCVHAHDKFAT